MLLKEARSLLFIPAVSAHLVEKAARSGADAVIVDLEDSVPADRKDEARNMAREAVAQLAGRVPVLVRINAAAALREEDIASLPLPLIDGVMLPKVESAGQVRSLARSLAQGSATGTPPLPIVALIETARGVVQAQDIAAAHPGLCALGFGAEDYAEEMLVEPRPESLLWPAQAVATCARAFGLACWGLPGSVTEIADMDAFAGLVALARRIGFSGTVCIHPRQLPAANAGFSPSEEELAWAHKVLGADEEAAAEGLGATVLDGRMVDRPVVERARRLIARAGSLRDRPGSPF